MAYGPSQQELEWQYEHRQETRAPGVIAACAATGVASIFIIVLRFVSRRLMHGRLQLEASDWLVLVAWVFFAAIDIAWAYGTTFGIGRHAVVITDVRMVQILSIVGEAFYVLAMAFIKFSVLALYSKIFPIRKFRYWVWSVTIFVAGWAISGAFVAIFQCTPIDYVWRPDVPGSCVNLGLQNIISGVINVFTDVFIVAMVIPLVWNLHIAEHKKWLLIVTFAVGSSACIVSIVRLPFSIKVGTNDGTWDAAPTVIVSVVEITIGMLAVSIPTYRPLYRYLFGGGSDNTTTTYVSSYKETLHKNLYGKDTQNDVNVTSPGMHIGPGHDGINVTNHIELIRHTNRSGSWVRVLDEDEEEDEEQLYKSTKHIQPKSA
ncbi:hypothetical protein F5Y19DRAFT_464918 [Xylariaceae sp. FL1651]|nr:hypothetical protein F5Y19DRAFT_464918 [Xylariaceae sp. FL1651]